ncbi:MAG: histidine--tRNA ligase [Puniceicoccales bacterium]|jgi:histidyl-tRNA synthetase|nr:histidine--tRNA ligase [Puniceicoccales bacterium]
MFTSLPGFREFYPAERALQNHIFDLWRRTARRFGFQEWDAPVLEPLELFTEKSGEEIVRQLFNFEDKGGRKVTLRPEMTPSLARLVAARAGSLRRPIKWFAIGENFRYEKQQKGRLRSFYQFNADILGEAGPAADAEIIALCIESLRAFGFDVEDFRVRLSDRTLWFLFLESLGIPESAAVPVLAVVDKLERTSSAELEEMMADALVGTNCVAIEILPKVKNFVELNSLPALEQFFSGEDTKILARLGEWKTLLDLLKAMNLESFISIDLTIVRGLAYYTGFVFEAFERTGDGRALAGGGRYDALVKKLGGSDMPATGFGMGDVTLKNLLEDKSLLPVYSDAPDFYAIVLDPACRTVALTDVSLLRRAGIRTEYSFKDGKFGKLIQAAEQAGARYVLVYGPDEVANGVVKIRDTQERREITIPSRELVARLQAVLEGGLAAAES